MKQNKNKVIVITGGIGSGKSTASSFLREIGIPVIDADKVTRELMSRGTEVTSLIIKAFGNNIVDEMGEINREAIAKIVFSNPASLKKLNDIVHPRVTQEIEKKLNELQKVGHFVVALDIPLPKESGFLNRCDQVWVITADKETRISRLMENRGYTRQECIARMNSQPSEESYKQIASLIIDNSSDQETMKNDLKKHITAYRKDLE